MVVLFAVMGNVATIARCAARGEDASVAVKLGERLFSDSRLSQPFAANSARATRGVSCQSCHFVASPSEARGDVPPPSCTLTFADGAPRSAIPPRDDGRVTTPRNSPSLVDALTLPAEAGLLHFDAEFASAETLVKETFLGRNFGWLPQERPAALRHFARIIREDTGERTAADSVARVAYSALLLGGNPIGSPDSGLSEAFCTDPSRASDEEIVDVCARLVVAYVRTLRFSRDAAGNYNGSPYDAFLAANRLPRAPAREQSLADYGRRLGEQIAGLRVPQYVTESGRTLRQHNQPFRFGELELNGARVFFRGAVSDAQKSGAGNCAECHVPPHFSDFKFHNTGVAQDEYDALHGRGAFEHLVVPGLAARERDFDRWLPPSTAHPAARGPFLSPAEWNAPGRVDLGLWNVYSNPDLPAPQPSIERMLNPARQLSRDEVLARSLGRFKTSTLRDPGQSAPYFHTGAARSLEDVIEFYRRASALAHAGRLRNAPPEYFAMRLGAEDIAPLSAFLRALNEDYPP